MSASQLFNALTSYIVTTSGNAQQARDLMFWLLGSFGGVRWPDFQPLLLVVCLSLAICILMGAVAGCLHLLGRGRGCPWRACRTHPPAAVRGDRAEAWQTLSGGDRQRIHIARALAQTPRVMFLDEPTNHLDIHHQIEILRMVRDLDLNLAAMFCDRIVVLDAGSVCACGTPDAVLTQDLLREMFRVAAHVSVSLDAGRPHIRFLADRRGLLRPVFQVSRRPAEPINAMRWPCEEPHQPRHPKIAEPEPALTVSTRDARTLNTLCREGASPTQHRSAAWVYSACCRSHDRIALAHVQASHSGDPSACSGARPYEAFFGDESRAQSISCLRFSGSDGHGDHQNRPEARELPSGSGRHPVVVLPATGLNGMKWQTE